MIEPKEIEDRTLAEGVTDTAAEAGLEVITSVEHIGGDGAIVADETDHDIDLIVMGPLGRCGLDRQVLGKATERVVRTSPVPAHTVRMD